MDLVIFWNHVGREHGGLGYTEDIQKNSSEVIQKCLEIKEQRCRNNYQPNKFIKYNESTLIELPSSESDKKYIIIYFIDRGLQFSLNFKSKYPWWLIDVVDITEIRPNVFCVHDLFIDISVNLDGSYHVLDMDEFEMAINLNVLSHEQITRSLKSLHSILAELNSRNFPNKILKDLEQQYM
jgi:predicted RNA-binding protein associated with RNAse of E/G family